MGGKLCSNKWVCFTMMLDHQRGNIDVLNNLLKLHCFCNGGLEDTIMEHKRTIGRIISFKYAIAMKCVTTHKNKNTLGIMMYRKLIEI